MVITVKSHFRNGVKVKAHNRNLTSAIADSSLREYPKRKSKLKSNISSRIADDKLKKAKKSHLKDALLGDASSHNKMIEAGWKPLYKGKKVSSYTKSVKKLSERVSYKKKRGVLIPNK